MTHSISGENPGAVRVLIVEDEPMVALGIEDVLVEAGFAIAGVAARLESALALIESGNCDAAVVDANLAGVSAEPAAIALKARGLPFIVSSGYSQDQLKGGFAGEHFVRKPCPPELLIKTLTGTVQAQQHPGWQKLLHTMNS